MPPGRQPSQPRPTGSRPLASLQLASLYDRASPLAVSPTLHRHVTLNGLRHIEAKAKTTNNPYLRRQVKTVGRQITKVLANIGNGQAIQDLKDAYAEATTYIALCDFDPTTTAIPRQQGQATPDFSVKLSDGLLYLEFKSLNMVGGTSKQHHHVLQNDHGGHARPTLGLGWFQIARSVRGSLFPLRLFS